MNQQNHLYNLRVLENKCHKLDHNKFLKIIIKKERKKKHLPNKFNGSSMVIFDRRDSKKIPERGPVLLVVQEPATVALPVFNCISYFGYFSLVCFRPLKKSAAPKISH